MPDNWKGQGRERLSGALALVVGPSGAGKDALINGARERLCGIPEFYFVRRIITRDATPQSSELHTPITDAAFEAARVSGDYFLHWQAHGRKYAISSQAANELQSGRIVVASVSRTVITQACRKVDDATIIQITASASVRETRLASRGREAAADITSRLSREVSIDGGNAPLLTIDNNGPLEYGIDAMVSALLMILARLRAARGERS